MRLIHDGNGLSETLLLAISWNLSETCQIEGCNNKTSAIMCLREDESPTDKACNICICEEHYQKGMKEGKFSEKVMV